MLKRQAFQRVLIAIIALLSPLSLLTLFMAFTCVNPMGIAFLTEFTIANESPDELWVTPIGAVNREGLRSPLPYSLSRNLVVFSARFRDFHIAAGSHRQFIYDWDDIQFSEILVRNKNGDVRVLPTGLEPTVGQFRQPSTKRFVITDFDELEAASDLQLAALTIDRGQRIRWVYGLAAVGLIPPLLSCLMLLLQKKSSQA